MKKSDFSEKQLEQLLRDMPKIKDHRDPRDIYQNIAGSINRRKKKAWIVPSIASVAALFILALLTSNFLGWNTAMEDSSENRTASESRENMKMAEMEETQPKSFSEEEENMTLMEPEEGESEISIEQSDFKEPYTALYESDADKEQVLTFHIPDQMVQNIVPVSVVVPKEDGKSIFQQFNETMSEINEEEWSLSEYYPLNAYMEMEYKPNVLNVDVPSDHVYGEGSTSEHVFTQVINETAKMLGVEKVTLSTEGNPGITFGNMGTIEELEINEDGKQAYYLYYPNQSVSKPYLVPYTETPLSDIEAAFQAMKGNIDSHGLTASIPSDFNVKEIDTSNGTLLIIRLDENASLKDNPMMIHTIEAILLTAKSFQFDKVKIESSTPLQIGKFVFNEEWDVPIAPNLKRIDEE